MQRGTSRPLWETVVPLERTPSPAGFKVIGDQKKRHPKGGSGSLWSDGLNATALHRRASFLGSAVIRGK